MAFLQLSISFLLLLIFFLFLILLLYLIRLVYCFIYSVKRLIAQSAYLIPLKYYAFLIWVSITADFIFRNNRQLVSHLVCRFLFVLICILRTA